jgi:hypothetical protein
VRQTSNGARAIILFQYIISAIVTQDTTVVFFDGYDASWYLWRFECFIPVNRMAKRATGTFSPFE